LRDYITDIVRDNDEKEQRMSPDKQGDATPSKIDRQVIDETIGLFFKPEETERRKELFAHREEMQRKVL
jgi:hypothetical protein